MSYKKGKDLKIKGIENLDGMPSCIIFKTDEPICIVVDSVGIFTSNVEKKPEGFEGW